MVWLLKSIPGSGWSNLPAEKEYHRQLPLTQHCYQPTKTIFSLNFLKVMYQNHWKCNYLMEFNSQVLLIPFINLNDYFPTECLSLQREKQRYGKITLQHFMLSCLYNYLGINNNRQMRKLKFKSFNYSSGSLSQSVQQLEDPGVFTKCLQVRIQTHRGILPTHARTRLRTFKLTYCRCAACFLMIC